MSTRKIKDAKDLSTNELIYFKGHAQATYMSDGRTVEDAISSFTGGSGGSNSGGSSNSSEDVRYFTDFTVEHFIEKCETEGIISNDNTELFNAMKNNKIICVPYEGYDRGFMVASYQSDQDSSYPLMYLEKGGIEYYAYTGDDGALYGTVPVSNYHTSVDVSGEDNISLAVYDNIKYTITSPVNNLILDVYFMEKGSEIVFSTGDNPTLSITHIGSPEYILWANGISPLLEPNTFYELSFGHAYNASEEIIALNAVLTSFKLVES